MQNFRIPFTQKYFIGQSEWKTKQHSIILVQCEEDVERLWLLLCKQDEAWLEYKDLIRVSPPILESEQQLDNMCKYCGKTTIYNIEQIQSKIPFLIYQKTDNFEWNW